MRPLRQSGQGLLGAKVQAKHLKDGYKPIDGIFHVMPPKEMIELRSPLYGSSLA